MLTSTQIRQQFIDFFVEKCGHTAVPSSPVVPHDDPTLLFTNAGMNQFKDVFLGVGDRPYSRAVDTQKCIRAGGKHNDLDDVGKDTYHHTFFEMLGNWSFGDYFKKEAITWAWQLLTDVWGMDPRRLHATVFEGNAAQDLDRDDEAAELWRTCTGIDPDHIHLGDMKDNFWEMGDTGPCGPCSEIHIDLTDDYSGGALVNRDDPRVIEIWNLVFIQYNRSSDGSLAALPAKHVDTGMGFERLCAVLQGKQSNYDTDVFTPLFEAIREITKARPYGGKLDDPIDVAYRVIADHIRCLTFAIADGAVPSNEGRGYVLRRILRRAVRYGRQTLEVADPFFYRLVPAVVELMGGAFPELNQHPGDIADLLKEEEQLFGRTLDRGIALFESFAGDAFARKIAEEQARRKQDGASYFLVSVSNSGQPDHALLKAIDQEDGWPISIPVTSDTKIVLWRPGGEEVAQITWSEADSTTISKYVSAKPVISGSKAFELYATYGFPLDLTQLMADERGMAVDVDAFEQRFAEHKQISKGEGEGAGPMQSLMEIVQRSDLPATRFVGYDKMLAEQSALVGMYGLREARYDKADDLQVGQRGALVVDTTPFYAEAGGQVGDTGRIHTTAGSVFRVEDVQKIGDVYFHLGELESGSIQTGRPAFTADDSLMLEVDVPRRQQIMSHHTATHVLNHKLRAVLGDHVQQKGSLVDPEKTRFDFSHNKAVDTRQIERIEAMVGADIRANLPVTAEYADQEEALKINGLRAVFGEKYPPKVRVVSIGVEPDELLADPQRDQWMDYSIEFCGGTHVQKTGQIGDFALTAEEAVAKGVRRVIGVCGALASEARSNAQALAERIEALDSAKPEALAASVSEIGELLNNQVLPLVDRAKIRGKLEDIQKKVKAHEKARSQAAAGQVVDVARTIAQEQSGPVIVAQVPGADGGPLRKARDGIRQSRPDSAMFLAAADDQKVALLAAVPKPMIDQGLKAGDWVKQVAPVVDGGGGGRPDMAQAGGKNPQKVEQALEAARQYAAQQLG